MLVTLEGLDGAGKTSAMEAIADEYPHATQTTEPTECQFGSLVRTRLSDNSTSGLVDFFLFMCDRRQHVAALETLLSSGSLIVSDRYSDSTRAYQPVVLRNEVDAFETIAESRAYIDMLMEPWNREPDKTLYIDIDVDTAMERSDADEKYERRAFLEDVRDNYERLCENNKRIVRIDGEQSRDAVAAEVCAALEDI